MNEHAGAASALSVLIVGVFAVLLHEPQRQPPRPASPPPSSRPVAAESAGPSPAPIPPPPTPVAPPSRHETALIAPPVPPVPSVPKADRVASIAPDARSQAPAARSEAKPAPARRRTGPRGGFTVVEPGEALVDVAIRVYGSAEAADSLWKANRDQLADPRAGLARGMLLRTP